LHGSILYQPFHGTLDIREVAMSHEQGSFTLKLTPEQQEQVRQATGKMGDTLELSIEELEERIAPSLPRPHVSGFHTP
jgi:hypothetical protein